MDLLSTFTHLDNLNTEVTLFRSNYRYTAEADRWTCTLRITTEGTELKVHASALTGDEAISVAYAKLLPLISAPTVQQAFSIPTLTFEAKALPDTNSNSDLGDAPF